MLYEVARALVQRILRDKIILGLLVILGLGFFMGGLNSREEPALARKGAEKEVSGQAQQPGGPQAQPLDPKLATDFVTWWLSGAMDYSANMAAENHRQAFAWMTTEAQAAFQTAFWPPDMAEAISSGRMVAAFHVTSVQAEAINPDGSIVVGVTGTLITDIGSQPAPHQVQADFLVRRIGEDLRIAGVYNRVVAIPGPSVY